MASVECTITVNGEAIAACKGLFCDNHHRGPIETRICCSLREVETLIAQVNGVLRESFLLSVSPVRLLQIGHIKRRRQFNTTSKERHKTAFHDTRYLYHTILYLKETLHNITRDNAFIHPVEAIRVLCDANFTTDTILNGENLLPHETVELRWLFHNTILDPAVGLDPRIGLLPDRHLTVNNESGEVEIRGNHPSEDESDYDSEDDESDTDNQPTEEEAIRLCSTLWMPTVTLLPLDSTCAICLQSIRNDTGGEFEAVNELPCAHLFHTKCIGEWSRHKFTCPTCRCSLKNAYTARAHGGNRDHEAFVATN